MIRSAREVFKGPEFSAEEVARIFAAASGQTLHFGSTDEHGQETRTDTDRAGMRAALLAYARGEEWRAGLTVSVRRFYQVLAATRENCCQERVLGFQKEGLSLRQLGRLFDRSVPTIQGIIESGKGKGEMEKSELKEAECSE